MQKNNKITFLSHLLIWFVLFSMPFVLSYGQEDINRIIMHFWIPVVFYAIIFYFNYFVFIDRYLFTKKMLLFIGINFGMIALFILLRGLIEDTFFNELLRRPSADDKEIGPPFRLSIYIQMLSYIAPLLFSIAIKTTKRLVETESERKEAVNYQLQSELQHLHYQLQPHFFFNALNNIYSMVDISPDQAKKSIHSLSKLMRYMLYETDMELVPLSKEIDFMKKYIDLMKLRMSEKTTVKHHFPSEETGIKIAPLLFISLIENAFKHGVSASKESLISITLTCDKNRVIFTVENDDFPKKTNDKSGSGIGLQNLEKRLQLLYPNNYRFENSIKNQRFSVTLSIETS